MKLSDYIRGFRKGKEAHRLEKEAMRDPFLADALEGYSRVESGADEQICLNTPQREAKLPSHR